jgi:EAL domain-containing protein (putative c-di-GMP-specific phosphodiesterase class I)
MAITEAHRDAGRFPSGEPFGDPIDEWAGAIDAVLAGGGLAIAVQPVVDLARGVTVGYEALSRFTGPPLATPDVWFARAERLGLGAALDAATMRQAVALRSSIPEDCFLAINVDPNHLTDPRVVALFAEWGSLRGLVVELTEHTVVSDYGLLQSRLDVLRDAGARIAIDDTGSGYAGLQWLMSLAPDIVKLDRALVAGIDADETKLALVAMLGDFVSRIDSWMLAEGIERQQELDALVRLGVPLGQGYLLERPTTTLWPDVQPDISAHLKSRTRARSAAGRIAPLVEIATVRPHHEQATFGDPDLSIPVIIIDEQRHPVALWHSGREHRALLAVRGTEHAADVLVRAMARPTHDRWSPLVCVTEAREVVGIVRMERLVGELLEQQIAAHRGSAAL